MLKLECVESFTWTHSIEVQLFACCLLSPLAQFKLFVSSSCLQQEHRKQKQTSLPSQSFFLGWLLVLGYMWAAVWTMNNMQSLLRASSLPNKRRQRMKIHYIAENWIYLSFIISGGSPKHESKQHGKSWCFELCASNVYLDMLEWKQQKL